MRVENSKPVENAQNARVPRHGRESQESLSQLLNSKVFKGL